MSAQQDILFHARSTKAVPSSLTTISDCHLRNVERLAVHVLLTLSVNHGPNLQKGRMIFTSLSQICHKILCIYCIDPFHISLCLFVMLCVCVCVCVCMSQVSGVTHPSINVQRIAWVHVHL